MESQERKADSRAAARNDPTQGLSSTYEQAHVGLDLLTLVSLYIRKDSDMKLLSIAIPCYNSEKYMRKCIDSLLIGGEDVEILIIDDGSTKDRTAEIADEYEAQFPTIVRAIH